MPTTNPTRQASSTSGVRPAKNGKVVVGVDDAEELLEILKFQVEEGGYTFFGATSGAECVRLTYRVKPHLIILDIRMPDLSGFETCRRLRLNPNLAQVPIMFLTGHHTTEDVQEGLRAGGNDFIAKPFRQDELLGRVRHWSGRRIGTYI